MLALIIGGAGSGKSEYAEKLAVSLAEKDGTPLVYLATMAAGSPEADARIARHRRNRAGRNFVTVEKYTDLSSISFEKEMGPSGCGALHGATVLLEDLGNLLGNEMFLPEGGGAEAVLAGIRHIKENSRNLILVANEVFSDGRRYDKETQRYLREMAMIHRQLAAQAQYAAEIVCGRVNILKEG